MGNGGKEAAWEIRAETPGDAPQIDALVEASFGPGRFAKTAYRLREGVHPESGLSFVAIEKATLRGSVRFWPVFVGAAHALLLGPLAVQSDQRGRGIGIALMQRGIGEAKARGHRAIILVGDEPYYSRVGFKPVPQGKVKFPGPVNPARILGLGLVDGAFDALEGEVTRARIDDPVRASGAPLGMLRNN